MATLATVADLAAHVQRDFDAADAYSADLALQAASSIVRSYLRSEVTTATTTVGLIVLSGGLVRLPRRPVTAVVSVMIGGTPAAWTQVEGGILLDHWRYLGQVAVVTYTAGYAEGQVPGEIRAVVLDVAARRLENPRGLAQETMGSYSYSLPQGTGGGLSLTPDERSTLDRSPLGRPGSRVGMLDLS